MMKPMRTIQEYYDAQSEYVISELMKEFGLTLQTATKMWYTSKTKEMIQEKLELYYISRVRCFEEMLRETNKDRYWMTGTFD